MMLVELVEIWQAGSLEEEIAVIRKVWRELNFSLSLKGGREMTA